MTLKALGSKVLCGLRALVKAPRVSKFRSSYFTGIGHKQPDSAQASRGFSI